MHQALDKRQKEVTVSNILHLLIASSWWSFQQVFKRANAHIYFKMEGIKNLPTTNYCRQSKTYFGIENNIPAIFTKI